VRTDTPGFTAEIQAGNSLSGPFRAASGSGRVGNVTTFEVHVTAPMEYYVVWLTKLPPGSGTAHVNEVRAFGA
jgi:hypothetical protein